VKLKENQHQNITHFKQILNFELINYLKKGFFYKVALEKREILSGQ